MSKKFKFILRSPIRTRSSSKNKSGETPVQPGLSGLLREEQVESSPQPSTSEQGLSGGSLNPDSQSSCVSLPDSIVFTQSTPDSSSPLSLSPSSSCGSESGLEMSKEAVETQSTATSLPVSSSVSEPEALYVSSAELTLTTPSQSDTRRGEGPAETTQARPGISFGDTPGLFTASRQIWSQDYMDPYRSSFQHPVSNEPWSTAGRGSGHSREEGPQPAAEAPDDRPDEDEKLPSALELHCRGLLMLRPPGKILGPVMVQTAHRL